MKVEELVSVSEIETVRRPHVFLEWFDGILSKIHAIKDDELKRQVLMHTGIAKKIYEEVFPLYRLLQEKKSEWSSISVRNILGNQPGDVEIIMDGPISPTIPQRLEITYACSGREHMLRMEHLAENGWTSLSGPVLEVKEKRQQRARIEIGCKEVEETVGEVFKLIQGRMHDKIEKTYGQRSGLIIYIEDDGTFQHSATHQARLNSFAAAYIPELKRKFHVVYLILASNGRVIELRCV